MTIIIFIGSFNELEYIGRLFSSLVTDVRLCGRVEELFSILGTTSDGDLGNLFEVQNFEFIFDDDFFGCIRLSRTVSRLALRPYFSFFFLVCFVVSNDPAWKDSITGLRMTCGTDCIALPWWKLLLSYTFLKFSKTGVSKKNMTAWKRQNSSEPLFW